ncbi:hypothetical protein J120_04650 [candidate division TM6 bacterium JCVI TM6SC1]|uniref:Uncharacterized protein n=1 Tax=candidate division TM6 bacterium JCVI TM6SC1 TaxID=1306947 RepID=A0A0D2GNL0_9BACT|nr:hypothetical protein J120_04650 [candidate division TM6 bacterium JCVI TM6SC1]
MKYSKYILMMSIGFTSSIWSMEKKIEYQGFEFLGEVPAIAHVQNRHDLEMSHVETKIIDINILEDYTNTAAQTEAEILDTIIKSAKKPVDALQSFDKTDLELIKNDKQRLSFILVKKLMFMYPLLCDFFINYHLKTQEYKSDSDSQSVSELEQLDWEKENLKATKNDFSKLFNYNPSFWHPIFMLATKDILDDAQFNSLAILFYIAIGCIEWRDVTLQPLLDDSLKHGDILNNRYIYDKNAKMWCTILEVPGDARAKLKFLRKLGKTGILNKDIDFVKNLDRALQKELILENNSAACDESCESEPEHVGDKRCIVS